MKGFIKRFLELHPLASGGILAAPLIAFLFFADKEAGAIAIDIYFGGGWLAVILAIAYYALKMLGVIKR